MSGDDGGRGAGVVWLKRDLRLADHAALHAAAASGRPLVVLYIYEPSLLAAPDCGRCHVDFINQSLEELSAALQRLGGASGSSGSSGDSEGAGRDGTSCGGLTMRHAEAVDALAALHAELAPLGGIAQLWSHEETGTPLATARNAAVAAWARRADVEWTELPQTGVTRNLASRDGWSKRWTELMEAPMLPAPTSLRFAGVAPGRLMGSQELGVAGEPKPEAMLGGESRAQVLLDSFLGGRAAGYSHNMSSPVSAWDGCSRLSPYLAWGCISLRSVHQHTKAVADALRAAKKAKGGSGGGKASSGSGSGRKAGGSSGRSAKRQRGRRQAADSGDEGEEEEEAGLEGDDEEVELAEAAGAGRSGAGEAGEQPGVGLKDLAAFTARLRWRSHFMQKLEDQQDLVHHNMCRAYDGARNEGVPDAALFEAWCQGRTGYPLVDAVVRCLLRGGWINFRMRAMLFSFAAYHLWLHWRFTADFMAAHFLDYEPGIHYPQAQMQSGTTGINAFRVYSPSKQVADQDPEGVFIKKYVPELANVPPKHLAEPWRMPPALQQHVGCVIGRDYPAPIVQPGVGRENCRQLHAIKASLKAKEEASQVYQKHGSRKRPTRPGGGSGGSAARASGGGTRGRGPGTAKGAGADVQPVPASSGRGRRRKAALVADDGQAGAS